MEKIKVLVVEDEVLIADDICKALHELSYAPLDPAITYTEAIAKIESEKPDIAILDIHLSGSKTGIDLAKKIRQSYNFPFIFLTANSDNYTLNKAKEVMPNAYLIKPFSKKELYTSIEIALHNFTSQERGLKNSSPTTVDSLFIKDKSNFRKIYFKDILYFKSAHVYIEIVLKNGQNIVTRSSLNEVSNKLNNNFLRVHRGFIINKQHLKEIQNNVLVIENTEIPIGSKYKVNVLKAINYI
jgi:DNA-binding LytR/AlgR family response regulator